MAGRGPAPNQNRQRRNKPARGDWLDLEPLEEPVLPELGDLFVPADGESMPAWMPVTRLLWAAWRQDPVTATWNASDTAFAVDTILLHAAAAVKSANEIRLRMESLGLTPKGRRDLRLRLMEDSDEPEEPDEPSLAAPRHLKAV